MIETLFNQWNFMRLLRLVIGAYIVVVGFQEKEVLFGMIGGVFVLQAVMNVGCFAGNCAVPTQQPQKFRSPASTDDVTYEEVK